MTLPNREYAYTKKRTHRPVLVALVAAAGVLVSLTVLGLSLVLAWQRMHFGYDLNAQLLDLLLALLVTLMLIRLYWGVWELTPGSWWSHMLVGPVLIIGLLVFSSMVDTLAPFIANRLPLPLIQQAAFWLRILALTLIGLEAVTILVLLGQRQIFSVGRKKELWERVRH